MNDVDSFLLYVNLFSFSRHHNFIYRSALSQQIEWSLITKSSVSHRGDTWASIVSALMLRHSALLLWMLCFFVLIFHFPTEICDRFSSLKTTEIELELLHYKSEVLRGWWNYTMWPKDVTIFCTSNVSLHYHVKCEMSIVLKATIENKTTSVTTHYTCS